MATERKKTDRSKTKWFDVAVAQALKETMARKGIK